MPFALVLIGLILIIVAVRGTYGEFFDLLAGDFTGQTNFIWWVISIMVVGGLGYIPKLKPISNAFLVLILLVLVLSNRGFFESFIAQIRGETSTPNNG